MTSRDFCYWLMGGFESGATWDPKLVRAHLDLVFKHEIDPSMGSPEHQAELREIHEPEAQNNPGTDKATLREEDVKRLIKENAPPPGRGFYGDPRLMC